MNQRNYITGGPIRFAVMCDGDRLQDWQVQCVRGLLSLDFVELKLIIQNDAGSSPSKRIRPQQIVFRAYSAIFVRPRATWPVDMGQLFSATPSLHCKTLRRGKYREYFSDADLRTIASWNLDFIIRFGFGILGGGILNAARLGVWSFHHGDEEKYRGVPACFWEIYNGDNVTGAILQRLVERLDAGVVLKKGYFRTTAYSYRRNIDMVFYESARWPAQVCKDIRNGSAGYLDSPPSETRATISHSPTNLQTIFFVSRLIFERLRLIYQFLFRHSEWNIGLVNDSIHAFLSPDYNPRIAWLPRHKRGRFRADPFSLAVGRGIRVFFEDFDYRHLKGVIETAEIESGVFMTQPEGAITLPFHISYPYVFEDGGEVYCIPETSRARELGLYRAKQFPFQWEKVAVLIEKVAAVDSTIFRHEDRWWLTFTQKDKYGENLNLHVWYASDIRGPWKPHENNPVKTDVRSSRPAGTPFYYSGCLYRPAQDCSRGYGRRIIINKVLRLTPAEFIEEPVASVDPLKKGPYPDGLHTISAVGDVTLIDGMRLRFVPTAFVSYTTRQIKKLLRRS